MTQATQQLARKPFRFPISQRVAILDAANAEGIPLNSAVALVDNAERLIDAIRVWLPVIRVHNHLIMCGHSTQAIEILKTLPDWVRVLLNERILVV